MTEQSSGGWHYVTRDSLHRNTLRAPRLGAISGTSTAEPRERESRPRSPSAGSETTVSSTGAAILLVTWYLVCERAADVPKNTSTTSKRSADLENPFMCSRRSTHRFEDGPERLFPAHASSHRWTQTSPRAVATNVTPCSVSSPGKQVK